MAIWNRCKHEWKIENKDTFDSAWSQMNADRRVQAVGNLEMWMFRTVVHTTYLCRLCGKTKEIKIESHRRK